MGAYFEIKNGDDFFVIFDQKSTVSTKTRVISAC